MPPDKHRRALLKAFAGSFVVYLLPLAQRHGVVVVGVLLGIDVGAVAAGCICIRPCRKAPWMADFFLRIVANINDLLSEIGEKSDRHPRFHKGSRKSGKPVRWAGDSRPADDPRRIQFCIQTCSHGIVEGS